MAMTRSRLIRFTEAALIVAFFVIVHMLMAYYYARSRWAETVKDFPYDA